ncbi:hypothetical protein [Carboxylicivirga taeanensis]|uniref:hypothetical protein n=1 Tax=Carboxylicivirga taeanensis TaxID=1416875 RepID=UPI003F6E2939
MKTLNVHVPDDKLKFVRELLNNLGFEWSLRSTGHDKVTEAATDDSNKAYELDEDARKKAAKMREESLKDVISKIEELRKKR